jgi:hypothetical protein
MPEPLQKRVAFAKHGVALRDRRVFITDQLNMVAVADHAVCSQRFTDFCSGWFVGHLNHPAQQAFEAAVGFDVLAPLEPAIGLTGRGHAAAAPPIGG